MQYPQYAKGFRFYIQQQTGHHEHRYHVFVCSPDNVDNVEGWASIDLDDAIPMLKRATNSSPLFDFVDTLHMVSRISKHYRGNVIMVVASKTLARITMDHAITTNGYSEYIEQARQDLIAKGRDENMVKDLTNLDVLTEIYKEAGVADAYIPKILSDRAKWLSYGDFERLVLAEQKRVTRREKAKSSLVHARG